METAKRIDCPNPLPEGPATALLTEMLVPVPYKALEKKADKKAPETMKGLWRKAVQDASSEDDEAHSSPEGEEEKEKERAAPSREAKGPKRAAQGTRKGPQCKVVIDSPRTTRQIPPTEAGETRGNSASPHWGGEEKESHPAGGG